MNSDNEQQAIEKKFLASWDKMEQFYTDLNAYNGWEWLKPIHGLIAELRKRGYDKQLHARLSMFALSLSRLRKYGILRPEQGLLTIDLYRKDGGMTVTYFESPKPIIEIEVDRVELTPEVEQLLLRLLNQPID